MVDWELSRYYRARAPEYEQIYYRDVPERRREIDDEADRLRHLTDGKTVLELACGTGYWTKVMSASARMVVASDISREMIAEAAKKEYITPPHFVCADLLDHCFRENSFDCVVLGFWFSHHPRQDFGGLSELVRFPLKDGGVVWMIDNNPPAEGPTVDSERVDEHGNNYKRRYLNSGEEYIIIKNYFQREELEQILSAEFAVKSLVYKKYYWSAVMGRK
ncbi:MAG: class I SAM-dependent methyltransferase [candidate division Zixibacteria bacterium]|nr:class I SAM-dependent methyltransferase [candidate division Zixibacteria bacterium]